MILYWILFYILRTLERIIIRIINEEILLWSLVSWVCLMSAKVPFLIHLLRQEQSQLTILSVTIDPNVGVCCSSGWQTWQACRFILISAKITPAVIEFVDIAGLCKGASKGEGLGNQFLANIREVDAIVHVVRCFEDSNIVHVDGSIDPIRDIETINLELIFSDIEVLDRRLAKQKRASYNNKDIAKECDLLEMT